MDDNNIFVILDCDQHLDPEFLHSTLQYFSMHPDIAMVITPQRFRQTVPLADVLNHINADYWDLMMPGLDGLGFISCPGEAQASGVRTLTEHSSLPRMSHLC